MQIYELSHEYEDVINNYDIQTHIAVYSTLEKAQCAMERLKNDPHFVKHPEGFCIAEKKINRDGWTKGFVSIDEL